MQPGWQPAGNEDLGPVARNGIQPGTRVSLHVASFQSLPVGHFRLVLRWYHTKSWEGLLVGGGGIPNYPVLSERALLCLEV